jgi:hypothetical protein
MLKQVVYTVTAVIFRVNCLLWYTSGEDFKYHITVSERRTELV